MYEQFKSKARRIQMIDKKNEINDEQSGYDVELLVTHSELGHPYWRFIPDTPNGSDSSNPLMEDETLSGGEVYIHTLIVTVKGPATIHALRSVKHRIDSHTTVCLIQNGMGQVEELNREVFTDPDTRPTYMLGVISHGVHLISSFIAVHAGLGTVALGIVRDEHRFPLPPQSSSHVQQDMSSEERKRFYPSDNDLYSNISSRYLLRQLTRSPILCCAAFPYLDLFQLQLEKLAVNAVLNPLTALLDVNNGAMLYNYPLSRAQRLLLAEISLVIRNLPELSGLPNVQTRFSPARLEKLLLGVSGRTAANSSSMREDVRKLKETEIEYINGYIVKRGEEVGIKCVLNYLAMQLVKGKSQVQRTSNEEFLPYGVKKAPGRNMLGASGHDSEILIADEATPRSGKKY